MSATLGCAQKHTMTVLVEGVFVMSARYSVPTYSVQAGKVSCEKPCA